MSLESQYNDARDAAFCGKIYQAALEDAKVRISAPGWGEANTRETAFIAQLLVEGLSLVRRIIQPYGVAAGIRAGNSDAIIRSKIKAVIDACVWSIQ